MSVSSFSELTNEECNSLKDFRSQAAGLVSPENFADDRYLLRWLIARDFNVEKALHMLQKSVKWRAQNGMDALMETYKAPEVLSKYYVGGICGFDRQGFPVWIDPITLLDARGLLQSASKQDIITYKLSTVEAAYKVMKQQSSKLNKQIDQMNIIFDVEGLEWKHLWKPGVDILKETVQLVEDNYPEMLKHTYIIHAPRLFALAYAMLKPVLSKRTTAKVSILGRNWRETLLRDIDADQLPVAYGGTMVGEDGDPRCPSKVNYGGEVPRSYYQSSCNKEQSEMSRTSVARASSMKLSYRINVKGCTLRCQFKTESRDIGIGVYYIPEATPSEVESCDIASMETIVDYQRVECCKKPYSVDVSCSRVGTYVMHLDNSYSWTRSKKVYYDIEILKPSEELSDCSDLLEESRGVDF